MLLTPQAVSKIAWLCVEEAAALKAMKTKKERIDYLAPKVGKYLDELFDFKAILSSAGVVGAIAGPAAEAADEMVFTSAARELCDKVLMVSWPEGA